MKTKKRTKSLLWLVLSQFAIATVVVMVVSTKFFHQTVEDKLQEDLYSMMIEREAWLKQLEDLNNTLPNDQKIIISGLQDQQQERYKKMEELDREIGNGLLRQFIIVLALIFISLLIILQVLSRRSLKPFNKTLQILDGFSIAEEKLPKFDYTNVKEFVHLHLSLEKMFRHSISLYQSQKEFTENASHELHTPLAIMRTQLDLLIQQPDLTKKQSEIVSSLYHNIGHLTRLNKNLLFLANIEHRSNEELELIHVSELVEGALVNVQALQKKNKLDVITHIEPDCFIRSNRVLLFSMVTNLLSNAIRYNCPKGNITIILKKTTLIVSNTGQNKKLDEELIFHRFNKNHELSKGFGLGLSIVEKICVFHGWKIKYSFKNQQHVFMVSFNS
ncbi:HAMP domain-containing histidine kinase [Sinomicrobium kalidii]|uniref:sensor histidine kinase n=1 Tax=Sinomicrobium kalidii TaxID=2900738 RepID=UPI001E37A5BA|nr:HAMP domain-containing sensor histidine kinase [Sinomicrobium kalidii]UGU15465.1 HAMP domain-containing histidine kinase [Sinomicrobium kalidii]